MELLETIFSLYLCHRKLSGGIEIIVELSRRVLVVQKDLGLQYVPKLSSVLLSLFVILLQSELEHEQLFILNLLRFILKWKYGNGMSNKSSLFIWLSIYKLISEDVSNLIICPFINSRKRKLLPRFP